MTRELHYVFRDATAGDIRFALSPLAQLGLSLRLLHTPSLYPLQEPWIRQTRVEWEALDLDLLRALVRPPRFIPDFLVAEAAPGERHIEHELDLLAHIDPKQFRAQLAALHGRLPDLFLGPDAVDRTLTALRGYWNRCFSPHWPRMKAVLDADIVYRGRIITERGMTAMLNELSPSAHFHDATLSIRLRIASGRTEPIGPDGLTAVPSLFTDNASVPTTPDNGAFLLYSARGQGGMWAEGRTTTDIAPALAALVGQPRAVILSHLTEPLSTTMLAVRLGTSASAVNQHLRVLFENGLVSKARRGRAVMYHLTDLGKHLIETRTS